MLEPVAFARRSAFTGLLKPVNASGGAGVTVTERANLSIATVIARQGVSGLAEKVRSSYGIDLVSGPKRVGAERIAFIGIGPRNWLALQPDGGSMADDLQRSLGDAAAVFDQSDGYAVLRLSGPKVRAVFEKGLAVDLHPRAFRPGDAAVTTCSHLGIVIWQLDGAPTYEVALFRSLAAAFWHWLADSAGEFGLDVAYERG